MTDQDIQYNQKVKTSPLQHYQFASRPKKFMSTENNQNYQYDKDESNNKKIQQSRQIFPTYKQKLSKQIEGVKLKIKLIKSQNYKSKKNSSEYIKNQYLQKTERAITFLKKLNYQKKIRQQKLRKQYQITIKKIQKSTQKIINTIQNDRYIYKQEKRNKIIQRMKKKENKTLKLKTQDDNENQEGIFYFTQIKKENKKRHESNEICRIVRQQQKIQKLKKQITQKQRILNRQRMKKYSKYIRQKSYNRYMDQLNLNLGYIQPYHNFRWNIESI